MPPRAYGTTGNPVRPKTRRGNFAAACAYTYDPCNYLVLSVPLPFEVETFASPEEPLLGVLIKFDAAVVSEILLEMDDMPFPEGAIPRGICSTTLTDELTDATVRLLQCLGNTSVQLPFQPDPAFADADHQAGNPIQPPVSHKRMLFGIEPDHAIAWFHFSARNTEHAGSCPSLAA